MSLVERIKSMAITKNTNIAELERKCAFGNGTIRKWDYQSPSIDKVVKLANQLSVSLDYLILGDLTDDDLSEGERQVLSLYRHLHPYDQRDLVDIAKMKADRMERENTSSSSKKDSGQTA